MASQQGREAGPFTDLPAALVDDVTGRCHVAGAAVLGALQSTFRDRERLRKTLEKSGLVKRDLSLPEVTPPTTCATDGSYSVERLLTVDLAVGAAVAVEGLTHGNLGTRFEGLVVVLRQLTSSDWCWIRGSFS